MSGAISTRCPVRSSEEGDEADFEELYNDRSDNAEMSFFNDRSDNTEMSFFRSRFD